jgi:small subunit ribosomal protein S9
MADKKADQTKETKSSKKNQNKDFIFATGKRKSAVARVRLYTSVKSGLTWKETPIKKGDIIVNEMPISSYFSGEVAKYVYTEPLRVTNAQNKYTFSIKVDGGGKAGQLEAVVTGISNALIKVDSNAYRAVLKKKGFLTRDARVKERRKVGTGGKARREKQSPKR